MASNESSVLFDQPGPKGQKTIRIVNWIAGIVFVIAIVLVLMRLHNPPDGENQLSWDLWKPALDAEAWTDFYLPGLWATVKATVLAVVGSVVFGLLFGMGRVMPGVITRGFRCDRRIRPRRSRAVAHDLLLALVRVHGHVEPGVLGRGSRSGDLQRFGCGRAGPFRRWEPAERTA